MNLSGNLGWLPTSVINQTVGFGSENILEFFPGATIVNNIGNTVVAGAQYGASGFTDNKAYDRMVRNFYKTLLLPTIRGALDRYFETPFVIYKEPFDYKNEIRGQNRTNAEESVRYNKGGYVKQLVIKLKENN